MVKVFTPNDSSVEENMFLNLHSNYVKIFLAGTIGGGKNSETSHKVNWQNDVIKFIEEHYDNVVIFNPRRENWPGKSDKEGIDYQIKWELNHMRWADKICMNILSDSLSPISLMEIGLWAGHDPQKMYICCKEDFWRYDNVRVVSEYYYMNTFDNTYEMINGILSGYPETIKKK